MSPAAVSVGAPAWIQAEEPTRRRMMRAFLFIALGVLLWMAVNWRRAMGLWFGPDPGRLAKILFCGFVWLNLAGGASSLWDGPRARGMCWEDGVATVIMGGFVLLFFRTFPRMAEERRRLE